MKINKELLSRLYKEYNELYFDGKLGKCDFAIFPKSNPSFGWYNGRDGKNGKPNDKIWIGTCIKWNKEKLKIVMIHEMIHMYNRRIDNCKLDGLFGHGKYFRRQCKRIKKDFGIDILSFNEYEYIDKKNSPSLLERFIMWLIDR